jgi:hypothetical protein
MNALLVMTEVAEALVDVYDCTCTLELAPNCRPRLEARVDQELLGEVVFDQELGFLVTAADQGTQVRFDDATAEGNLAGDIIERLT